MAHGAGLGKERTKIGRFLDMNGLTQGWLERHSGISGVTITKICGDRSFLPNAAMKLRIVMVLQEEVDPHVDITDFW